MTHVEYHELREKYKELLRQMDAGHLTPEQWDTAAQQTREMESQLFTYERKVNGKLERMF